MQRWLLMPCSCLAHPQTESPTAPAAAAPRPPPPTALLLSQKLPSIPVFTPPSHHCLSFAHSVRCTCTSHTHQYKAFVCGLLLLSDFDDGEHSPSSRLPAEYSPLFFPASLLLPLSHTHSLRFCSSRLPSRRVPPSPPTTPIPSHPLPHSLCHTFNFTPHLLMR